MANGDKVTIREVFAAVGGLRAEVLDELSEIRKITEQNREDALLFKAVAQDVNDLKGEVWGDADSGGLKERIVIVEKQQAVLQTRQGAIAGLQATFTTIAAILAAKIKLP